MSFCQPTNSITYQQKSPDSTELQAWASHYHHPARRQVSTVLPSSCPRVIDLTLKSKKFPTTLAANILFIWTLIALAMIVSFMWPTASSIVTIWSTSNTFAHGFLVFPAFLWMVWRKRETLASITAKPEWRVLFLIAIFGACWLTSGLIGVQVGQHTALVLILMSTIWAVLGTEIAKAIQFPILFLFFLAPVGEELVPFLMELTADMTVWAIQLTGIPIFREGLFFSLPSGNWSVVEACSGINYLISSISLGALYAYLSYSSYKLRLLFMMISALLPIIANGIRAYLIVMLGHFSDNKLATGIDHLIYGWLFFGIVMFLLFSIGSLFRESSKPASADQAPPHNARQTWQGSLWQQLLMLLALTVAVGAWPAWANIIRDGETDLTDAKQQAPLLLPGSTETVGILRSAPEIWQPRISGYDMRFDADYHFQESQTVRAIMYVYVNQRQGKEMISSTNVLVRSQNKNWRSTRSEHKHITTASGKPMDIIETSLHSADQQLLVWQWYQVGKHLTTSTVIVKAQELISKLTLSKKLSTIYVLVTDATPNAQSTLASAVNKIEKNK